MGILPMGKSSDAPAPYCDAKDKRAGRPIGKMPMLRKRIATSGIQMGGGICE